MEYMSFTAYAQPKDLLEKNNPIGTYKVKINPETFDRSISVAFIEDERPNKGSNNKSAIGSNGETYSFDLLFDGTGVTDSSSSAAELKKDFDSFLNTVYRKPKSESADSSGAGGKDANNGNKEQNKKPAVNCVIIHYCGQDFNAQLDSLTIKYLLFDKDGNPLRIRASCRFSSVEETAATEVGTGSSGDKGSASPSVDKDTPGKDCILTEDSFEETVSSAKENDSIGLLCCCYPREDMTERNYTPADYTPVEGYDV